MKDTIKYIFNEIRVNYDDEFWWRNRILHHIVGRIQKGIYGTDGIDIMSQDWDNLIILDACRVDYFEEVADLSTFDDYQVVTSKASATPEFVAKHFKGREFGDTVYVNSNPHISRDAPGSFHKRYDLWADEFNEEYGTVMPETAKEGGLRAEEEFPNKRTIVHYNQPHGPYIGENYMDWDYDLTQSSSEALQKGLVTESEFRDTYKANLEEALPTALELAECMTGRTVITADHGELFGKRQFPIPIRAYAHPPGLRDPDLIQVPWAVIEDEQRKKITDEGTNVATPESAAVEERLADLGYKT